MTVLPEIDFKQKNGSSLRLWLIALLGNLIFFSSGLQFGWVSPNLRHLTSDSSPTGAPVSESILPWITSVNFLGAVIATPVIMYLIDKIGRKNGVLIVCVPQALCWILKLFSGSEIGLVIARLLSGAGTTTLFVVLIYLKEVSTSGARGIICASSSLSYNLGVLVVYAIGGYLDYYTSIWIVFWIPIVAFFLMFLAPESPEYLLKHGEDDKARSALAWVRAVSEDDKELQNELEVLRQEATSEDSSPSISYLSILKNPITRKAWCIVMALVFVQACSGYAVVVSYTLPLLEMAGVTFNPTLQSLAVPAVTIIGAMVSMSVVEKVGRKPLMITSSVLSVIALTGLATCLLLLDENSASANFLPITFLVIYMFGNAIGFLPLPNVIAAEMFSVQIRAKLMSVMAVLSFALSFIIVTLYSALGTEPSTSFFVFAAISLFGTVFVTVFLPETKSKSVAEIEEVLSKRILCC